MSAKIVPLKPKSQTPPNIEKGKVAPPRRRKNSESRSREYLTSDEVGLLMTAAGRIGRHQHRDKTLILMMFRHALRVSEAVSLRWDMVDLNQGLIHIQRLKNGLPSVHPLRGPQLRALRRLRREYPETPYLFATERGGPMTASGVWKMIARAGKWQRWDFQFTRTCFDTAPATSWPTMARTHERSSITWGTAIFRHTVCYTELAADSFKEFWKGHEPPYQPGGWSPPHVIGPNPLVQLLRGPHATRIRGPRGSASRACCGR